MRLQETPTLRRLERQASQAVDTFLLNRVVRALSPEALLLSLLILVEKGHAEVGAVQPGKVEQVEPGSEIYASLQVAENESRWRGGS